MGSWVLGLQDTFWWGGLQLNLQQCVIKQVMDTEGRRSVIVRGTSGRQCRMCPTREGTGVLVNQVSHRLKVASAGCRFLLVLPTHAQCSEQPHLGPEKVFMQNHGCWWLEVSRFEAKW